MNSNPGILLSGIFIVLGIYLIVVASRLARNEKTKIAVAMGLLGLAMLAWPAISILLIVDSHDRNLSKKMVNLLAVLRINLVGFATGLAIGLALTGHLFDSGSPSGSRRERDTKI